SRYCAISRGISRGAWSTTANRSGANPAASQPASIAPPMLPQPKMRIELIDMSSEIPCHCEVPPGPRQSRGGPRRTADCFSAQGLDRNDELEVELQASPAASTIALSSASDGLL